MTNNILSGGDDLFSSVCECVYIYTEKRLCIQSYKDGKVSDSTRFEHEREREFHCSFLAGSIISYSRKANSLTERKNSS